MHDQGFVVVEFGKQVFGSTPKPGDAPTRETPRKALGKRDSQIASPGFDLGNQTSLEHGCKAHANCLNFPQFRHRSEGGAVMPTTAPYTNACRLANPF